MRALPSVVEEDGGDGRAGEVAVAKRRTGQAGDFSMDGDVDDRSAVLIIRVWVESGMESFRGRLMSVEPDAVEGAADGRVIAVTASPSDVVNAVRAWLDSFERAVTERIDSD